MQKDKTKNSGWITLHRKITKSVWYGKPDYIAAWIHILLKANHKPAQVMMNNQIISLKRGQFISGRKVLSKEIGISEQKIRTILKVFKSCHQINQQPYSKFSVFTVLNYDEYQTINQQITNKQPTTNQQPTTNNNDNNDNNDKDKEKFNFKKSLIELGVDKNITSDWLKVRSNKKASNTQTAFNAITKQIALTNMSANEAITLAVENSWAGFKADWINNKGSNDVDDLVYS